MTSLSCKALVTIVSLGDEFLDLESAHKAILNYIVK